LEGTINPIYHNPKVILNKDISPFDSLFNVQGIYQKPCAMKRNIPEENQKVLDEVSTYLREYRLQSGYTQKELSDFAEIHRNTISHAETCQNISLLTLIELTNSLDIRLADLFEGL